VTPVLRVAASVFSLVALSTGLTARSQTSAGTGAGRISGVVMSDDQKPVRRAIVTLSGGDRPLSQNTITDDEGRFDFAGVPAGRFTIAASRASYVPIAYGATQPGRPGSSFVMAAGQQLANLRLQLVRGAIITGTVRDTRGDPMPGIGVRVERRDRSGTLVYALGTATVIRTDDRGVYRVFGLVAGTYLVSAVPAAGTGGLLTPSDGDVDATLRALQAARGNVGRPSTVTAGSIPTPGSARSSTFGPVYYPSALSADEAAAITLATGEERQSVDIAVRLMSTSDVSGTVVGNRPTTMPLSLQMRYPDGRAALAAGGIGRVQPDGSFRFPAVLPGRYLLTAVLLPTSNMALVPGATSMEDVRRVAAQTCAAASTEISVTGSDISGLSLALRPCVRVVGRLDFAGTTLQRPAPITSVRITQAMRTGPNTYSSSPLRGESVNADGTFDVGVYGDLLPGEYRILGEVPGATPGHGWTMRSLVVDGVDVTDSLLVITEGSPVVRNAVMTFTDQHPALVGRLETAAQQPAADYTVVAFTTNQTWWAQPFRRVRTTRPGANGDFAFEDLPPGEYFLTALTDIEPDEWQDRDFLATLVSGSVRVTVGESERHRQDLRLAR
jgi:hypothetical protein